MERMDKERRTPECEENEKDSNLKETVTDICVVNEIVVEDNTDFALTTFLRSVNQALKDGIVGVMERARSVTCTVMNWCWGMIRVLLTDGVPWILRQLLSAVKFVFGRRMRSLLWENIMLVILAPLFLIAAHGAALRLLLESFGLLVLGRHRLDLVHRLRRHVDWNQKRGFFSSAEKMG